MSQYRSSSSPVETAALSAPASCPFCRSAKVSATGKITAETYYRCDGCGQIWHPQRLREGRAFDARRR